MALNVVEKIDDLVKVNNVLISVSDKTGLDVFVPELIKINPEINIFSTGGTYSKIVEILGGDKNVVQVSDYTGQPETQGGLVKTLDFKIYLGLLTETYNDDHKEDLKRTGAKKIDMVVVNLYPFASTIAKEGVTVEMARSNIDIGGPTMIRASAKNYLRVASVVNPEKYGAVIEDLKQSRGMTSLKMRYSLATEAFEHTAVYDRTIADFLMKNSAVDAARCYKK